MPHEKHEKCITRFNDGVTRKEVALRRENCTDDELVYFLKTAVSFVRRDEETVHLLKRRGIAWLKTNRPNLIERDRHVMLGRAIPLALSGSLLEDTYQQWLMRHSKNPENIEAYNLMMRGTFVGKRTLGNRIVRAMGFRQLSNRWWLERSVQVMPRVK